MHVTEILNRAIAIGKQTFYAICLNKTFHEHYIIYLPIAYHTHVYTSQSITQCKFLSAAAQETRTTSCRQFSEFTDFRKHDKL